MYRSLYLFLARIAQVLDWNQSMFYLFYIAVVLITAPPMIFYACPTEAEKMQYDMRENEETDASIQLRRGSVTGLAGQIRVTHFAVRATRVNSFTRK